jgi:hypothetical protein
VHNKFVFSFFRVVPSSFLALRQHVTGNLDN